MSEEFTQESLLAKIREGRKGFEQVLARVPESRLESPVLHDGWSVKDVLGHLAFWQARQVGRFETLRAGGTPEPLTDMDGLNARVLADARQLSLQEVRHSEAESYRRFLAMVEGATPDELFEPGHFPALQNNAFVNWIPGDSWGHYEEHLPEILAWLEKEKR